MTETVTMILCLDQGALISSIVSKFVQQTGTGRK